MTKLSTILDQPAWQLTVEELLAILDAEERDDALPESVTTAQVGADHGQRGDVSPSKKGHEPHNGYPCGWLWQVDKRLPLEEAVKEARAAFERKFGIKAKTIWANPATGDGKRLSPDRRIGRGYLLLGPLPKKNI